MRNMSLPRNSSAYPSSLLAAVQRAADLGEFIIPTKNPRALRLQLQGLRGALRRENASATIDSVMFCLQDSPPALVIKSRDNTPEALEVLAALGSTPKPSATLEQSALLADQAEDLLARILSGAPNA